MPETLSCPYASLCSGCDWIAKPYAEQRSLKIEHLRTALSSALGAGLPEIEWVEAGRSGLRDRVDLMIDSRSGGWRLGLYDQEHREIADLEACPQLSAKLEEWLKAFRHHPVRVARGSVRLRVSPTGSRGVWLDLANVDVKRLLDERTTLDALRAEAIVEIGQKRKRLVEREGKLKLSDPVLEPWFETYAPTEGGELRRIPLYCTVGSFTQPGFVANRALVGAVLSFMKELRVSRVAEFGSGIGNFTLPLAFACDELHAYEVDGLALEGLRRSLSEASPRAQVTIHEGNYQIERKIGPDFTGMDLVMVDPPRSGLMKFLDPVEAMPEAARPPHFLYVSCFAESFSTDARRLINMGYRLKRLAIVDQFPQSHHYEIVAHFQQVRPTFS